MTIDLAARWLGGSVVAASDESFGFKENLLTESPADFRPGRYDYRGEIVDGWETRRRRSPGHDWAIVRLGVAGVVRSVDVDTSFFTGNFPPYCEIDACCASGYPAPDELGDWFPLVPRSALAGDQHNVFEVNEPALVTHVRLAIYPDGGVARLRVHGDVIPDPSRWDGVTLDLASAEHGAEIVASSDEFYTTAAHLIRPDRPRTMGEGWETSRRRDGGHDFATIRLAAAGEIRQIEIDTSHFKYNATSHVELWASGEDVAGWQPLLERTRLQPDTRHVLAPSQALSAVQAVRVDAFPDGGIARVRLIGTVAAEALCDARRHWAASQPESAER